MIRRKFVELTAKLPYKNFALNLLKVVGLFAAVILVGKIFPHFAGVVLCLILLVGYYGLIARCLKFFKINFRDALRDDLPRILLASIVGTGFIALTVASQHTIYIWDQLETWEPTIECVATTFTDPHQALGLQQIPSDVDDVAHAPLREKFSVLHALRLADVRIAGNFLRGDDVQNSPRQCRRQNSANLRVHGDNHAVAVFGSAGA